MGSRWAGKSIGHRWIRDVAVDTVRALVCWRGRSAWWDAGARIYGRIRVTRSTAGPKIQHLLPR